MAIVTSNSGKCVTQSRILSVGSTTSRQTQMSLPKTVSGFTVIPVSYRHSTHIIYAKKHVSSKPAKSTFPADRTLFLVNIPVDSTDRELSLFFRHCGTVEQVFFDKISPGDPDPESGDSGSDNDDEEEPAGLSMEVDTTDTETESPARKNSKTKKKKKDQPVPPSVVPLPITPLRLLRKTGGIAHIVFLDSSSLAKALVSGQKARPWPSSEEPRGLAHYRALYDARRPPLDIVKAHADSAVELYDFEVAKSKQKSAYRKGEEIVDEDGFTLVRRGGAYGKTLGGGVGVASKQFHAAGSTGRKKKKPKEKVSFYAFQKAEKQRKAILDLKRSFEADKVRIEKMKESRRFRPY